MNEDELGALAADLPNHIHRTLLENLERQNRFYAIASGIDPDNRPTVLIEQPRDPEWIAARTAFAERWNALAAEGRDNGFLEYTDCYECGGELAITAETTEWVEQPDPDYNPDKPNPYTIPAGQTTITIPRADR